MCPHDSEKLRLFYAIEQANIDAEIERAAGSIERFLRHSANSRTRGSTPADQALDAHGMLVAGGVPFRKGAGAARVRAVG